MASFVVRSVAIGDQVFSHDAATHLLRKGMTDAFLCIGVLVPAQPSRKREAVQHTAGQDPCAPCPSTNHRPSGLAPTGQSNCDDAGGQPAPAILPVKTNARLAAA